MHYAGYPAAADRLRELCDAHGLALIEDVAHAPSATLAGRALGTWGLAGAFSFFSNKVLSVGEGGLLCTDSDAVAAFVRSRRSHAMTSSTWERHRGRTDTYDVVGLGYNYRLDEPRAALLLSRLQRLEAEITRRRELTVRYRSLLARVDGIIVPFDDADVAGSSCYVIPIMIEQDGRQARGQQPYARARNPDEHLLSVDPPLHRLPRALPRRVAADHRAGVANRAHASVLPAYDTRGPGPGRRRLGRGGRAMSNWRVPLTDIAMPERDVQAVMECLQSGWLTMGPRTQAFEQALARHVGTPHVVTVSSGTAALHLALLAAGIGPGDEVIVPAFTFVANAATVRYTGAEPVLCDVRGARDFNIDPDDAAQRITPRTRAIVAVHFCGYPADVAALRALCDEHGLLLIEDCAQAIGARIDPSGRQVGTIGELGAFSFFSKKQLCVGEGGMVTTADERLAERVRLLRSHAMTSSTWDRHRGHDPAYDVVDIGFNYRLDEPRAALGLSRLERLEQDIASRRAIVRAYRERLAEMPGVELAFDEQAVERSSHFAFAVLLPDRSSRDRFREELKADGIQTTWYPALHTFAEYRRFAPSDGLAGALEAADRHCALPLSSTMDEAAVDVVVEAVRAALY